MKFSLGSLFVNLAIIFGGMLFLKGDPRIILGYDDIKDNPKKTKKMKRDMRVIAIIFLIFGFSWLIIHALYFCRNYF